MSLGTDQKNEKIYSTGSKPSAFYRTSMIH